MLVASSLLSYSLISTYARRREKGRRQFSMTFDKYQNIKRHLIAPRIIIHYPLITVHHHGARSTANAFPVVS